MSTLSTRQRHFAIAAAVGSVAVLLPGLAIAQVGGFGDVSPGYTHAPGIEYVADSDITAGCGDGSDYCPNTPVNRGQMATFLFRSSGNAPGIAPSVRAQTAERADSVDGFTPFSAALEFGDEVELISYGDLTASARCIGDDGGSDRAQVVVTSSTDGWASTSDGTELLATDEDVMFSESTSTGNSVFDQDIDDGAAISVGGDYLGLQGETLALGLNTLGADCLVAGVAFTQDVDLS